MGRKKPAAANPDVIVVNVLYEDGTQSSNRRLPGLELTGYDDEETIRQAVETQDQKIAALSGQSRGPIKSIQRVTGR
jgi:hypothetical protein